MTAKWVLGFMSGTSMDGVDAALIRTDGVTVEAFGPSAYRAYEPELRHRLRAAAAAAAGVDVERLRAGAERFDSEATAVAEAHLELARDLLSRGGAPKPDLVGFHGQTLLHRPDQRYTLQIGDAALLARGLGVGVIHDFRSADVAAGGQGAPFAPLYHAALARRAGLSAPVAFLNLGGVANVTWLDPGAEQAEAPGALLAFDTGPANAQLDDWMEDRAELGFDSEGRMAASGRPRTDLIEDWLADCAYFRQPPPKSLDRQDMEFVLADLEDFSVEDGAATLTAFSAAAVAAAQAWLPSSPSQWVACGGGRRNPTLMAMLGERLDAPIQPVDSMGVDGDMLEAQAFAYLAARSEAGLAVSAPGATGAPEPIRGGVLVSP